MNSRNVLPSIDFSQRDLPETVDGDRQYMKIMLKARKYEVEGDHARKVIKIYRLTEGKIGSIAIMESKRTSSSVVVNPDRRGYC